MSNTFTWLLSPRRSTATVRDLAGWAGCVAIASGFLFSMACAAVGPQAPDPPNGGPHGPLADAGVAGQTDGAPGLVQNKPAWLLCDETDAACWRQRADDQARICTPCTKPDCARAATQCLDKHIALKQVIQANARYDQINSTCGAQLAPAEACRQDLYVSRRALADAVLRARYPQQLAFFLSNWKQHPLTDDPREQDAIKDLAADHAEMVAPALETLWRAYKHPEHACAAGQLYQVVGLVADARRLLRQCVLSTPYGIGRDPYWVELDALDDTSPEPPGENASWATTLVEYHEYWNAARALSREYKVSHDNKWALAAAQRFLDAGDPRGALEVVAPILPQVRNDASIPEIQRAVSRTVEAERLAVSGRRLPAAKIFEGEAAASGRPAYLYRAGLILDRWDGDVQLAKQYYTHYIERDSTGTIGAFCKERLQDEAPDGRRPWAYPYPMRDSVSWDCYACVDDKVGIQHITTLDVPEGWLYESYKVRVIAKSPNTEFEVVPSASKRRVFMRVKAANDSSCFCFVGSHGSTSTINVEASVTVVPDVGWVPGDPKSTEANPFFNGIITHTVQLPGWPATPSGLCGPADPHASTCSLLAQSPGVEVMAYDENRCGGKGAPLLGKRTLVPGVPVTIAAPTGRIRYDYRNAPNDPFHGDVGAWCLNGETVAVP